MTALTAVVDVHRIRRDNRDRDVCIIGDDTDHENTGRRIENICRGYSHNSHKAVLDFKRLCMAITDGVSELPVAIHACMN